MNISHLQYFLDAAKNQSISRSAQIHRVSHSAVSQAIRSLENELGIELMVHSKRMFELTQAGELCRTELSRVLGDFNDFKELVRQASKEPTGELILLSPQSLISDTLHETLFLFRQRYPKVRIRLTTGAAHNVRQGISDQSAQIGFLLDDGLISGFESTLIRKGHFVLAARKKELSLEKASVLITSPQKIEVQHLRRNFEARFKKNLQAEMEIVSWGLIKQMILKKNVIGYLPDYCIQEELQMKKLFAIEGPGSAFKYELKAIWNKNKSLHRNAKLFLSLLKKEQV
ncbi:MAG: hypothetical protein COT73_01955 [Bdellovibrio sp. CG10_big_fil_rev_8_21_14_0_10_47_8]|nr:MAG: hypothetical protein COT73_01955 [Bdellovibrio sp. CG10_big_fil_rev_8_21_14_0_10_47_8]